MKTITVTGTAKGLWNDHRKWEISAGRCVAGRAASAFKTRKKRIQNLEKAEEDTK
jgi:hypothetical protein